MTAPLKTILTENATRPGGHYSQAIVHAGLVYVSGQLGFAPGSTEPQAVSVEQQVRNCLANMAAILEAADSGLDRVIKTTVYISDVALWPEVNAVYGSVFGDHKPARTIVPCNTLHHGFQVEIDAIAAIEPG
ncbi:MAG: RidA family protein [Rhodospirillales bacterium]|nr:RidA family protein [Rhodospirillales bacterium]